jgi:hypothetical protein
MVAFAKQSHTSTAAEAPLVPAGLDTARPGSATTTDLTLGRERTRDGLAPGAAEEINGRLRWWSGTFGREISASPAELPVVSALFDRVRGPVPGLDLTLVPARAEVWRNLPTALARPALLAAMAQYRALNDVTGSIETNPFSLPPVDFLLRTLNDDRVAPETKQLCHVILQQGNNHRLYQLNASQRGELVSALQQEADAGALSPAALATMSSFNIKREEIVIADPLAAKPFMRAAPPPLPEAALKA